MQHSQCTVWPICGSVCAVESSSWQEDTLPSNAFFSSLSLIFFYSSRQWLDSLSLFSRRVKARSRECGRAFFSRLLIYFHLWKSLTICTAWAAAHVVVNVRLTTLLHSFMRQACLSLAHSRLIRFGCVNCRQTGRGIILPVNVNASSSTTSSSSSFNPITHTHEARIISFNLCLCS